VADIRLPQELKHPGRLVVLVTGGRTYADAYTLDDALDRIETLCDARHLQMTVIEGGARGADRIARAWCLANNVQVVIERADWAKHGRAAGPIRNQAMLDKYKPDLCLAAPGGTGTADMVARCRHEQVPVIELTHTSQ
jgi:hypothetical protein